METRIIELEFFDTFAPDETPDPPNFFNAPAWTRSFVLFGGAVAIFSGGFCITVGILVR